MLLTTLKTAMKVSKKDKKTDSTAAISSIFAKAKKESQIIVGLQYFLTKEVNIADFAESSGEKKSLQSGLKIVQATLALLASDLPVVDTWSLHIKENSFVKCKYLCQVHLHYVIEHKIEIHSPDAYSSLLKYRKLESTHA